MVLSRNGRTKVWIHAARFSKIILVKIIFELQFYDEVNKVLLSMLEALSWNPVDQTYADINLLIVSYI